MISTPPVDTARFSEWNTWTHRESREFIKTLEPLNLETQHGLPYLARVWQYYHRSNTMRVTQKGQVTIPLHVRQELGITSGTEVRFVLEGDHARLERVVDPGAVAERVERYAGRHGGNRPFDR